MWNRIWQRVRQFFRDSETIFFARLQVLVGSIWTVLVTVDLAPVLDPKWLTVWLIVSGAITEMARRSRADL